MTSQQEIVAELKHRIQANTKHFNGVLPDRFAIAWRAYLGGLLEWGIIDISDFDNLTSLLPVVDEDPSVDILRGYG